MKSQKGVTMLSLILYVASFLAITATIATITTFFYNNVEILDESIGSNSQYNKLNLYMLSECKKEENSILAWKESTEASKNDLLRLSNATNARNTFITFKDKAGNKNSFIYVKEQKALYYNSIKLCENVEDFKIKVNQSTGKEIVSILINIAGTSFTTEYVVGF